MQLSEKPPRRSRIQRAASFAAWGVLTCSLIAAGIHPFIYPPF